MGGMGSGQVAVSNGTVVSAFHTALAHQALVVLGLVFATLLAWNVLVVGRARRAGGDAGVTSASPAPPEAPARRVLRIGFGSIWLLDGLLQLQAAMPLGMVPEVIRPAESGSPGWVVSLLSGPLGMWNDHPVTAAAAVVWIQVGIGLWLLLAPRGRWSQLAGLASASWGLIVWVFGEAMGGIFAPGLTWMTGAPGGVVFYVAAGVLVALPASSWVGPALGRWVLRVMGAFFVGMAVLQAWPGRGFWVGSVGARPTGTLVQMVRQMVPTPQPAFLAGWLSSFAAFDAAHGFAVNLFVVVALAAVGLGFLAAGPRVTGAAVAAGVVLCLADWVLVEDLGFLGGVGTDPNSMLPMVLLFVVGYLALRRPAPEPDGAPVPIDRASPARVGRLLGEPAYALRNVALVGLILVGAVPMVAATTNSHASPILAEAVDGPMQPENFAAPGFDLVNQRGQHVSLAGLRGRTVALTFLDDVCTSSCPLVAQEMRVADGYLGASARHVVMVAINANPRFVGRDYLVAFDRQEGLQGVGNWEYLTGSLAELRKVWKAYGEAVFYEPGGAMIGHSEYVWVIGANGRVRAVVSADPGAGDATSVSSFAQLLSAEMSRLVASS